MLGRGEPPHDHRASVADVRDDSDGAWAAFRRVARDSGPLWAIGRVLDRLAPLPALRLRWKDRLVQPDRLRAQLQDIFLAWGMPAEHAEATAALMLYADLRGIDSHGSGMMYSYHRLCAAGRLDPAAEVRLVRESPTTALLDGGGGLGHVPGQRAMRLAVEKCRATGLGAVAVRNSGHFGAAGAYAEMASEAGFLGLATTSTREPFVVPTFGAESMLGTNPIAFAAPAGREGAFLLDMATSTVALGKLAAAWRRGRRAPAGWALGPRGRPERDPWRALVRRRLTPLGGTHELGGHKGYGLGVMVEILSTVLSGDVYTRTRDEGRRHRAEGTVGHFFLALDPAAFRGTGGEEEGGFARDLDDLLGALRATTPLDPRQGVLVAGDPERAARRACEARGIPLARAVVEDLRSVARASGVRFLLE
jgi:LDH2 family malate/lactate/ureidoglycolate dehydrogenase